MKDSNEVSAYIYRDMRYDEFEFWRKLSVEDYAKDLMENYSYSQAKADAEAHNSYLLALPDGISTKNNFFRVYQFEKNIVGCIWFGLNNDSAFLSDVIVFPEFQGSGVGKNFMRAFIDELSGLKVLEVELRVSPGNNRALNLYKKLGFRITGFNMSITLGSELI